MKTITILNVITTNEVANDIKNRFGLEMNEMGTFTCENDEAEQLESYLKQNYNGIRLCISENSDKYLGALVTWNADPYIVETDEQALEVMLNIQDCGLNETLREEEPEEFADMMARLDLTDVNNVKHIYGNGDITICFANDWEAC